MSKNHTLSAELKYYASSDKKPVYYASEGGKDAKLDMMGDFEMHQVSILNARYQEETRNDGEHFSLNKEGFQLVKHQSAVSNLYDEAEIKNQYLGEAEALVKNTIGAQRVQAFDFTLRADTQDIRQQNNTREPSTVVHNDYTPRSGRQRLHDILGEAAATDALKNQFMIVNVWRSIQNPVITSPLAVCNAQSVDPQDLIATERRAKDRIGELYLVKYNPEHKWFYFDCMQADEALLIKTFDSDNNGQAQCCIHTAFTNSQAPDNAPPRESIEVRTFAFFD